MYFTFVNSRPEKSEKKFLRGDHRGLDMGAGRGRMGVSKILTKRNYLIISNLIVKMCYIPILLGVTKLKKC